MPGFHVNQLFRLATAKIFCPLPVCMLVKSPGDIDSNAGVQGVVGTEDDIDGSVHGSVIKMLIKMNEVHPHFYLLPTQFES